MNADYKDYGVLLVDDHEVVLDGLTWILEKTFLFKKISFFSDALEASSEIKKERYDLFIIDLQLKEMTGFDLIDFIRSIQPEARIIVNTMHEEIWTINRLVEIDVDGIIMKSSASEHISQAVIAVLSGYSYLCPRFSRLKSEYIAKYKCRTRKKTPLTEQEKLILQFIVDGYTSREMASSLSLSENTIETHRKNIFMKLDVRNVAQLVSTALNSGILGNNWP